MLDGCILCSKMEKLESTCRTCYSERTNLMDISSSAQLDDSLKLRDVLLSVCPSLPMDYNDGLPQKICYFCCKQLEIAYKFQLQCKKSYEALCSLIQIPPNVDSQKDQPLQSVDIGEVQIIKTDDYEDGKLSPDFEGNSATYPDSLEFLDDNDFNNEIKDEEDLVKEVLKVEQEPQESEYLEEVPPPTDAQITCCYCDKKFFTSSGLRLHEKLTHKNIKLYLTKAEILTIECKFCHQVFEKKAELLLHCRHEHRKELAQEFTCNVCQKTFSAKARYDHHILFHSNSHFVCPVKGCKRAFIIKYKLADHMRLFHGISLSRIDSRSLKPVKIKVL